MVEKWSKTRKMSNKLDKPRLIKFLKSGIGHDYVHAKKPTEIHHFSCSLEMSHL